MMMLGTNIQSTADPLRKIQVEDLFRSLTMPQPALNSLIRQLRIAYQINPKQYSFLKRSLPYVVCGSFNPPYRRTENFGFVEQFIIDIDHLSTKGITPSNLQQRLKNDKRIALCFTSPSEDGLKLLFRLSERCYDAGMYSIFYKEFLRKFSLQYHLEQVVDSRTSDVTRACFLSVDTNAWMNKKSELVCMKEYIDFDNPLIVSDIKAEHTQAEKDDKQQKLLQVQKDTPKNNPDPDRETMERIKQQLNLRKKPSVEKTTAFIPEQLKEIIDELKSYIEKTGIVVTEIINIQYAKKIRMRMGMKEGEINLFFGKRGFSVVQSPRCGTNAEFNELCAELIQSYVDTLYV